MTTSIRWFFEGEPSSAVEDWYMGSSRLGPPAGHAHQLADLYLRSPDPAVSMKLRGTRFESKFRSAALEIRDASGRFAGYGEHWSKQAWPLASAHISALIDAFRVDGTDPWVEVHKTRVHRRYFWDRGTGIEGIPLTSDNVAGGVVEFTRLRAGGRDWWTVAIDVIARPEDAAVNLESALGWLFDEYPLEDRLPALENSHGYAAWLIQSAIPYPDSENAFRTS